MVMPPPMNWKSEIHRGLSSKKYCLMLKVGHNFTSLLLLEDKIFGSG